MCDANVLRALDRERSFFTVSLSAIIYRAFSLSSHFAQCNIFVRFLAENRKKFWRTPFHSFVVGGPSASAAAAREKKKWIISLKMEGCKSIEKTFSSSLSQQSFFGVGRSTGHWKGKIIHFNRNQESICSLFNSLSSKQSYPIQNAMFNLT